MKTLLIVIATIIGMIVAFYVLLTMGSKKMQAKAREFFDCLIEGNFVKAETLISEKFKKKITQKNPDNDLQDILSEMGIYGIVDVERYLGDYSIGTVIGTLSPMLVRADNLCLQVHLDMRKENNVWLIDGIGVMKEFDLDNLEPETLS